MAAPEALPVKALRRRCEPASLGFQRTDELKPLTEVLGQETASTAVRTGATLRAFGYNLYAMGSPHVSKRITVQRILESEPDLGAPLKDWLYLQDLSGGRRPPLLAMPPGSGQRVVNSFSGFIDELRATLPVMFDDAAFQAEASRLVSGFQEEQKQKMLALQSEAEAAGLRMLQTPQGFAFAPLGDDGEPLNDEQFEKLDEAAQKAISERIDAFNRKLMEIMQSLPLRQQALLREQRRLARERAATVVQGLIQPLRQRFQTWPGLIDYLRQVTDDVLDQLPRLVALEAQNDPALEEVLQRYRVNLLVNNADNTRAPIVYESNPTVEHLLGHIDNIFTPTGVRTDATMINPGALQRANGGFLLIDAERLLARPLAWDALKRALMDGLARIEAPIQMFSMGMGYGLQPEPMPLDIKVVLLGSRLIWYLLAQNDPDFEQLFKIVADFEDELPWTDALLKDYARELGTLAAEAGLRPLDAAAVARLIEFAARYADDNERLTAHTRPLRDVITESDFECGRRGGDVIGADDVEAAISARRARMARGQREVLDAVLRDTILISTTGNAIGQINGLSVLQFGSHAFGQPSRISATARLGHGRVIDIEREARLGGKLHSKGLMIVTSFLGARFARRRPLSLHASIVFEQSYGGVDGDSASVAEVCTLLSAIAEVPLRQDLAVTGSMNQHGQVQAIGGVNEKVEGFFRVCQARGLTGTQGVVIPSANVKHLMLSPEVVAAAQAGEFHVWAVDVIEQALELFTGLPAGTPDVQGNYPDGSLGAQVVASLEAFAEAAEVADKTADEAEDNDHAPPPAGPGSAVGNAGARP